MGLGNLCWLQAFEAAEAEAGAAPKDALQTLGTDLAVGDVLDT